MFFNQSWFWAILIPAIVTLGSLWLTKKYQIKLERIKLYETDQFKAYDELYKNAYCLSSENVMLEVFTQA